MPSIVLDPSTDHTKLVEAIKKASALNQTLLLKPGIHFTMPGVGQKIEIGANGLRIDVAPAEEPLPPQEPSTIKRPDFSVDMTRPDDNYGLYFVPAPPTEAEIAAAQWKLHTPRQGRPFEFDVVIRGSIDMTGLTVDCNMHQQGLENLDSKAAEHSAMVGFSGQKYRVNPGPNDMPRFIYVGFNRIALSNMMLHHGDFADDIWFSRGYFHPNIESVILQDITSQNPTKRKRANISFSGLSQRIQITNTDLYSLHLEELARPWSEQPRRNPVFTPSIWHLSHITARLISLSAKGHAFKVTGDQLTATEQFIIYQADGRISNSKLHVGREHRLFRLQKIVFDHVIWSLSPDAQGKVKGLQPTAQYGDPCFVEFRNNTFEVEGAFTSGELISSKYSGANSNNKVQVICRGCKYPALFATASFPNTHIALAMERGDWTFETDDFGNRDLEQAVIEGPNADVHYV